MAEGGRPSPKLIHRLRDRSRYKEYRENNHSLSACAARNKYSIAEKSSLLVIVSHNGTKQNQKLPLQLYPTMCLPL